LLSASDQLDAREDHDQRNDALRNDAVEAPDLQDRFFHVRQVERVAKSSDRRSQCPVPLAQQRQQANQQIPSDANRGHRQASNR